LPTRLGFTNRAVWLLLAATCCAWGADPIRLAPSQMHQIGTVDPRFQSFNIEMVEITGGRFWAPYRRTEQPPAARASGAAAPQGLDASLFQFRPPLDLANPRLRKLAAAFGPLYIRVSGTWANSTYFHDSADPAPSTPPQGFGGILTRQEWKGVVDFARAVDARIVTSFAISPGARDANGVWTPDQAAKFIAFTRSLGADIAAAEFFNEPNFAAMGGAPKGYDAAAYGRDFAAFRSFARKTAPDMLILGPGSVSEVEFAASPTVSGLKSADLLAASGPGLDGFSYHFYGAVSKRCGAMGGARQATPETALSAEWLSRTEREAAFYGGLRDRFEPGKPLWVTETGETACGGNPWAATFLDSFRYLEQLGRLAKRGVRVVMHNTLFASDYAVVDGETLTPRPNYWAGLVWNKLMGTTVLEAGASPVDSVHLFAHCLRGSNGGVALLAVNTDRDAAHALASPAAAERYTLAAKDLQSSTVALNGVELKLGADGSVPAIEGRPVAAGPIELAPASITFLAFANAGNAACRGVQPAR